jgi:hypothetical protein
MEPLSSIVRVAWASSAYVRVSLSINLCILTFARLQICQAILRHLHHIDRNTY